MAQKIKKYKATLTRQRKNVNTLSPTILLVAVVDTEKDKPFREHCWVAEDRRLLAVLENTKADRVEITFTAKVYNYTGSNGKNKSLRQVRNIEVS